MAAAIKENTEIREVLHKSSTPLKITLQRNQDGCSWQIHAAGANLEAIMPIIREADRKLKGEYGGKK